MKAQEPAYTLVEPALSELVLLAGDHRVDEASRRRLNELLRQSKSLRIYYMECMAIQVGMKRLARLMNENGRLHQDSHSFDPMLWQALAEDERTAERVECIPLHEPLALIEKVQLQKGPRTISKLPLMVTIVSLAALLLMIAYVVLNPKPYGRPVAVVSDIMGAQWVETNSPLQIGQPLYNTTYDLYLASGWSSSLILNPASKRLFKALPCFHVKPLIQCG
jgi:hypothetical protein